MADEVERWPIEIIPNQDQFFMRVHKEKIRDGAVLHGAFQEREDGMSGDWCKYSSAKESGGRSRVPGDNAVVKLNVGDVRVIDGLDVVHKPIQDDAILPDNRAHSNVIGLPKTKPELTQARYKLQKIAPIEIPLDEPWEQPLTTN